MISRQVTLAVAALALGGAPAAAQGHAHAQAGPGQDAAMAEMACTMGMLPHADMGGSMPGGQGMMGMMGGQVMQHGTQTGGMQHNMPGMQHGTMGMMQHGAAGQARGGEAVAEPAHPVTPAMLIRHAGDLGLTADQQAKVSELAKTSQTACAQHMQAAQASHQAAAALLRKATPDVTGYEQGLKEAAGHMIAGHVAVVQAGIEAEALLTPEQRQKLEASAAGMHGGK